MSDDIQSGTIGGMLAMLEWAGSRAEMNPATAKTYATCVGKIMEIDGEGWENIDVQTLDVDNQLARFQRMKGATMKVDSFASYSSRFRKSIELYKAYLTDGGQAMKALLKERDRRGSEAAKQKPANGDSKKNGAPMVNGSSSPAPPASDDLVPYPFPMRSGEMAYFYLPRSFPSSEVKRMTGYLESLAIDEPRALNPAPAEA